MPELKRLGQNFVIAANDGTCPTVEDVNLTTSSNISGHRPYGYYGAQAGTAAGQLTCKDAAKLQFPNERHMRKAFKKECKQAYKASRTTAAG